MFNWIIDTFNIRFDYPYNCLPYLLEVIGKIFMVILGVVFLMFVLFILIS